MLQALLLVSLETLNSLVSLDDSALGVPLPKLEDYDDYLYLLSDGFSRALILGQR